MFEKEIENTKEIQRLKEKYNLTALQVLILQFVKSLEDSKMSYDDLLEEFIKIQTNHDINKEVLKEETKLNVVEDIKNDK